MADLDPKKYQQVAQLLKEIRRGYADLKQNNPFDGQTARDFIGSMEDADDAIIKLVDEVSNLDQKLDNVGKNSKGFFQTLININSELKGTNEGFNVTKKAVSSIQGIAEKLKDDQEGINRLNAKELAQLKQKFSTQTSNIKLVNQKLILDQKGNELEGDSLKQRLKSLVASQKISQSEADIIAETKANQSVLKDINDKLDERIEKENKITESVGLTGQVLEGASGILKKIGLNIGSDKFKALSDGAREYAEELTDGDEKLSESEIKAKVLSKTLTDGAQMFSKELGAAFDAAIIKGFKDGLKEFGTAREDLAKTFGLGRSDANQLKSELNIAANSSGELHFNIADAVKGIQEFNAEIGGAVKLTQDELKTFSLLSNEFGLTNSQAAQFVKTAKLRGESAEDLTASLRGQVAILAEQEGVAINQQEVFANIGNISAANRLSMEGQGKSLADAAFQAAKLGMNQAQLEKTSNSLLDFESSIAAEMEAELMTGKQLNLEDARRAALMGDQEGLAKAISREIGTSADFAKMNVLQQQSLAKAFGMSREELAETLETQELLTGEAKSMTAATDAYNKAMEDGVITAEEQRKIGSEQLTNQLHAEAAGARFNDAITKLKDQLVPIIEIFGKFLDMLMDGVEFITSFKTVLSAIGKVVASIAAFRMFGRLGAAFKILTNIKGTLGGIAKTASKLPTALGGTGGAVKEGTKAATKAAGGGATKAAAGAAAKGGGKGIMSGIGSFFSKMNPLNAAKSFLGKNAGNFLKTAGKRIPLIGTAIEGIFAASDISSMIGSGETGAKLNQMVGKRAAEAIGSIGGTALGGFLGSFIPIPGVGTILGAMAGDALGKWVGGALAESIGAEGLGSAVLSVFGSGDTAEDFISRPGQPIQKFRADDVIVGGTNLSGGGNGEVVMLLKELISAVKEGGDVFIDGAKAGKSLALATSRMG
jgi:hypothetical protein